MTTESQTDHWYEGRDLEVLADMPRYYAWIMEFFGPYVHGRTLEIGAGIGAVSALLAPLAESLDLVEPSPAGSTGGFVRPSARTSWRWRAGRGKPVRKSIRARQESPYHMTKISIIVPAYNEEKTIVELLERVNAQSVDGFSFEVVVIDDGSVDGTVAALEARPELYDRLVKQTPNQGKGAAVIAGLKEATGDFILFQDADLEYNPAEYGLLLFPVREFGADIVMGSRFLAPRYTRVHYFWHKMGNRLITLLFNVLFNMTFSDIYSCYLLYRRALVDPARLKSRGWEQHAEILCVANRRAENVYEVPVSYHGRSYGEGKKIKARHVVPVFWMIIRKRFLG